MKQKDTARRRKAYPARTSKFVRRTFRKLPVPDPISVSEKKEKQKTMLFDFFVSLFSLLKKTRSGFSACLGDCVLKTGVQKAETEPKALFPGFYFN